MKQNKTQELLRIYRSLKSQREPWDSWWRSLRRYVLPNRPSSTDIFQNQQFPQDAEELLDTTAVESCQKLASAHMSYITPSHDVWFKWSAPDHLGGDEAESWYNTCSEIALKELTASNFYTEIHECFLDRVAFGTGSMFIGTNKEGRLTFSNIPCGQFVCAENDESQVDTYIREFTLSGYQAVRKFGLERLGEKLKKSIQDAKNPYGISFRFLHVVRPRKKLNKHTPKYESVYLSLDDEVIIEEGSYEEFPYLVTRFLKWGDGPYGIAPGRLVFPAIKQAQFLNKILDTLGEVAAFPRILELANQIGEVDLRAGGRTIITAEAAALHLPREWATQGRYDIGLNRLEHKQEAIKKAFFVPMLELWGSRSSGVTATEVMARENERVLLFSPSFTLFVSDLFQAMTRLFSLLFRLGKFPEPPPCVIRQNAAGEMLVNEPQVVYQSKIALILRRLQNEGVDRSLQRLAMMSQWAPDLANHIDWDKCFRLTARAEGLPEAALKSQNDIDEQKLQMEQQIAETAQTQQKLHPLITQLTQTERE